MYSVSLSQLVSEFQLENLAPEIDLTARLISKREVNRPALQLAGFFSHFDSDRIQVIGRVEHEYLSTLDPDLRKDMIWQIFQHKVPCFIICKGLEPYPEMKELAVEYSVPLFRTKAKTSDFIAEVIYWLRNELAERTTIHGVLVDVYGEGILIMGESGIGKSEMALELIKRGHRLVADDAVIIKRISRSMLIGYAPELIRHMIELRGIGILNVRELFGASVVKESQKIDMVIKLELWDENNNDYDRLGSQEEYIEILRNKVLCMTIPVRPGRNLAVICESAATNNRQRKIMGYSGLEELEMRMQEQMNKNK